MVSTILKAKYRGLSKVGAPCRPKCRRTLLTDETAPAPVPVGIVSIFPRTMPAMVKSFSSTQAKLGLDGTVGKLRDAPYR